MDVDDEVSGCEGLPHVATCAFIQCWWSAGLSAEEQLRRYAAWDGVWSRSQTAYDARCLLDSGLSPPDLELIWRLCCHDEYTPASDGLSGRDWMEVVARVTAIDADPARIARNTVGNHDPARMERVARLVSRFTLRPEHNLRGDPTSSEAVRAVLARLSRSGYPGLALRVFLRLASSYHMPMTAPLYQDLLEASRDLGFPDEFPEVVARLVDDGVGGGDGDPEHPGGV